MACLGCEAVNCSTDWRGKQSNSSIFTRPPKLITVVLMQASFHAHWSNPSVSTFAGGGDPPERMMHVALTAALEAIQEGWPGPPFDPFWLAEYRKIKTVPREDVKDARTVPVGLDRVQIEYNPNRPKQRIRFS